MCVHQDWRRQGMAALPLAVRNHALGWLHLLEFALDRVVALGRLTGFATRRATAAAAAGGGSGIHLLADLEHRGLQRILCRANALDVVGRQRGADISDLGLGVALHVAGNLVDKLTQRLLRLIDGIVGLVADLDLVAALAVFAGVLLSVLHHALDLVLREAARRLNGDALLAAGAPVVRLHIYDAVGGDVEGDLNLRDAARGRRNAVEDEVAQEAIVARHLALALIYLDLHARLPGAGCREDLALLRRDRRVALDEPRE